MSKKTFAEQFQEQQVEQKPVALLPHAEKSRKVYCSFGHLGESNWIQALGFELTSNIEDADVVVFGGGKDIDPGWYNEKPGRRTDRPSERDRQEKKDFEKVQELRKNGKSIISVGVCRGAQLACALSGGELIQDVGNHGGYGHSISTFDKKEFKVNSIHHQMLYPYKMNRADYKILAWSTKNISSHYLNGWDKPKWLPNGFKEVEVAYFTKTHFLAIQSHPEMMLGNASYAETVKWMQDLFLTYYNEQ